jgi:transketolase
VRFYAGLAPKYVLEMAEAQKNQKINQAKVGAGVTEQGMSSALDALVSHGRHRYGRSFRAGR